VVLAAAGLGSHVTGQEPAHPQVLDTLLVEVRGLRAAMENLASSSARVQLAMGRLQIQEQRVNTLVRRQEESRQQLAAAERQAAQQERELARFEGLTLDRETAADRQAIAQQVSHLEQSLADGVAELQRRRAEDAQLAETVAIEQGRWATFNQALDDLDRTLRERR
jgi:hypothetical protein